MYSGAFWGVGLDWGFEVGFCWLCKLFRKSVVVRKRDISEMRSSVGFGCGFSDWVLGCGKGLWISGKGWDFAGGWGCGNAVRDEWRGSGMILVGGNWGICEGL